MRVFICPDHELTIIWSFIVQPSHDENEYTYHYHDEVDTAEHEAGFSKHQVGEVKGSAQLENSLIFFR